MASSSRIRTPPAVVGRSIRRGPPGDLVGWSPGRIYSPRKLLVVGHVVLVSPLLGLLVPVVDPAAALVLVVRVNGEDVAAEAGAAAAGSGTAPEAVGPALAVALDAP